MACIFCKIIEGSIPSYKVYEDENIIAFLDISQVTKGHTLVLPKKHVRNIYEMDDFTATNIFKSIPHISRALKNAFKPIGLNIISNNEKPHQSVEHFHIHLLPRYESDHFKIDFNNNQEKYQENDYLQVLNQIKMHL